MDLLGQVVCYTGKRTVEDQFRTRDMYGVMLDYIVGQHTESVGSGSIRRRTTEALENQSLAYGNAAGSPRHGNRSHGPPPGTDWMVAMITPTTVAVILGGALFCLVTG